MTRAELRSEVEYEVEHTLDSNNLDEFAAEEEHEFAAEGQRDFFAAVGGPELAAEAAPDVAAAVEPDELPMWVVVDSTPESRPRPRPIYEPPVRPRRWPIFVPLAVGVVAASAGYGLSSWDAGLPSLPSAPAWWATAGPPVRAIPIPDVPAAVVTPPASLATPPPAIVDTAPTSGDTAQASGGPVRAAVDEALAGVSRSFRTMDAASLRQVWPGADVGELSRRFSTLKYQSLSFERCDLRPVGGQIVASCLVSLAAAPNVGDPALQRRRESWSIVFNRSGDRYVIGSVATR